ncbi:unnamed protein product, partial [Mesorhabditis belari]|uniref:Uncharacterized protein n=1 Tax=Mesorhabditis belari TaxID=2138241 RepID=A0AAF3EL81_9BILA
MVHGLPRHSQSQGSVERANADIEDILYETITIDMSLDNDRDAETYDVCALDKLEDSIVKERVEAHAAQKQQAKKMLESSEQRFAPLHIGSNQPLVKHQFMEKKDTNVVYVPEDAQQIDVPATKMVFFATPDVTTV